MELSQEKLEILAYHGDTLVVANPGTGKTTLLAHKYADLVAGGVDPAKILCLTFTNKACKEMEAGILSTLKEKGLTVVESKTKVFTFHAFALDVLGEEDILSSNMLRWVIFRYLKKNEVFSYSDDYLTVKIVPLLENKLSYLKSYGVTADSIDLKTVQGSLSDFKSVTKDEMDAFAGDFVDIFREYEKAKQGRGVDYGDLLIRFLALKKKPSFEHVLIDELQDVNQLEAEIALSVGKMFFAVGDKKQAIFGFQGGSTSNFVKFARAKEFVLSENHRSAQSILDFSKHLFSSNSADAKAVSELATLHNPVKPGNGKVKIYQVDHKGITGTVCDLATKHLSDGRKVAIIARTNSQLASFAKELERRRVEYSSTQATSSTNARAHVVAFFVGLFSNDLDEVKASLFSPFAPVPLSKAFEASKCKTLEELLTLCPQFAIWRTEARSVEDFNHLLKTRVLPVAVTYGRDYFSATTAMQQAFNEALGIVEQRDLESVATFLKTADAKNHEAEIDSKLVLTTVHKAKGLQYDAVIYAPTTQSNQEGYIDEVTRAILSTKGIDARSELEEEQLRIDFVAFTRAKNHLEIVTDKASGFLNDFSEACDVPHDGIAVLTPIERAKKAFSLFVGGDDAGAHALLGDENPWLVGFVRNYFDSLKHISFSAANDKAFEYLESNILGLGRAPSAATTLGSEVHALAKMLVLGEEIKPSESLKPFVENVITLLAQIHVKYPKTAEAELDFRLPLTALTKENDIGLEFKGRMDVVFSNSSGEYLIVDWKTDKDIKSASEHRQQLEAYRQSFCNLNSLPLEKVQVALAFVGLRPVINTGRIEALLDDKQPAKTAISTFSKRANKIVAWKQNPETFFSDLFEKDNGEPLWAALKEQYTLEFER